MGNYLQPISSWAKSVLEERENNPMMSMYRTPFVVLSSAAVVTKLIGKREEIGKEARQKQIEELINNLPTDSYKGCIISNNINNIELSYSPKETIVGIDFTGKAIVVKDEYGRKVSTPIITSVDVDTEEANNAIKTTRIGVKCFTLKQLEMFEMFFMKPGMSVMVEWGDSSLLKRGIFNPNLQLKYYDVDLGRDEFIKPYSDIYQALFITEYSKWDDYCQNFSNVFVPGNKSLKNILQKITKSIGTYDFAAGKISDYSYTLADDGTYDVTLTIYQMNQVSLALPKKMSSNSTNTTGPKQSNSKSSQQPEDKGIILDKIISDFNLDMNYQPSTKIYDWINEKGKFATGHFFNFLKTNKDQKNTIASSEPYLSLEFILGCLINIDIAEYDAEFIFKLPKYKKTGTNEELNVIPFNYDQYMISHNDNILFPSKTLPTFTIDDNKNPTKIIIDDGRNDKNKVRKTIDGQILNKSMLLGEGYELVSTTIPKSLTKTEKDTGNALNCFIKYSTVVRIWNNSVKRIEFLKDILNIVNSNSYGTMNLVLQPTEDRGPISVVCSRYAPGLIPKAPYRFKAGTIKSNVKNLTYTFQMDNSIFGKTIFNGAATLRKAFEKKEKETGNKDAINSGSLQFPPESYRTADFGMHENADGYFSLNNAEIESQKKIWKDYQKKAKLSVASTGEYIGVNTETTKVSGSIDYTSVINSRSVKFIRKSGQDPITLVYKDKPLIEEKILNVEKNPQVKTLLTSIAVSVTIDGFSGLRAGEVFHLDGVPETYNKFGAFQIRNIKHNITPEDGWSTTIEADWRIGTYNSK